MNYNFKMLEQLCLIPGVSGREHRVREYILREINQYLSYEDKIHIDNIGNVHFLKRASTRSASGEVFTNALNKTKVMVAGHMDQIGFMVRHISKEGWVYVHNDGSFDTRNLFARPVTIVVDPKDSSKDLQGTMNPACKPIHVSTKEEGGKVPELKEFVIDLHLPAEEVKSKVKIGQTVVLNAPVRFIGDNIVSQCLDNRVACWTLIEAIKTLHGVSVQSDIHFVFTVQQETGLWGAIAAAQIIKPDIGVAIDVTLAVDSAQMVEKDYGTELGKGPSLSYGDSYGISDENLIAQFESVASRLNIGLQTQIGAGGTDAGGIKRGHMVAKTTTLSIPCRYIHTVVQTVNLKDLTQCKDVLVQYLKTAK